MQIVYYIVHESYFNKNLIILFILSDKIPMKTSEVLNDAI